MSPRAPRKRGTFVETHHPLCTPVCDLCGRSSGSYRQSFLFLCRRHSRAALCGRCRHMGTPLVSGKIISRGCGAICRGRHSPRSVSIDSTSDVFSCITIHLCGGPLSSIHTDCGDWRSCHNHCCAPRCLGRALPSRSLPRIRRIRPFDEDDGSLSAMKMASTRTENR